MNSAERVWNDLTGAEKDVLIQLKKVTWDGNICSKVGRDGLIQKHLAIRYEGYTTLTSVGLMILQRLGKLEDLTK